MRRIALICAVFTLLGAAPLDSQIVLQRYALALAALPTPKARIFGYTVSQAGPRDVEEQHLIYRSGLDVRDETLSIDGNPVKGRTAIYTSEDRYAIDRIAPRTASYELLFLGTVRNNGRVDYLYAATPYVRSEFVVTQILIDGRTFLPRTIAFTTTNGLESGKGTLDYAPFGHFWMPTLASVEATIDGKPANERIAFAGYRFPPSLPPSTFLTARPLESLTLPQF
jgi:hypothetical protein